jgi:hypothetical protein
MASRLVSLCLLCSGWLVAQTDLSHGEIRGVITDPSGAVFAGVNVSLKGAATGLTRETVSGESGEYAFLVVPPGAYQLQFTAPKFGTSLIRDVRVSVGQVTRLSVSLKLGIVRDAVAVEGDAALLELERSHQASVMPQEAIRDLPIDRRDYLSFALLSPGIFDANAQSNNTDLRLKQTPTSGISFFGSNGRGNSVTIDGGEANDGGGGRALHTVSGSHRRVSDQSQQLRRRVRLSKRRDNQHRLEVRRQSVAWFRVWVLSPPISRCRQSFRPSSPTG